MLAFYVWKLAGLVPGILAATVVALLAWRHERRHDRPGLDGAPVARHGRAATLEALLKG